MHPRRYSQRQSRKCITQPPQKYGRPASLPGFPSRPPPRSYHRRCEPGKTGKPARRECTRDCGSYSASKAPHNPPCEGARRNKAASRPTLSLCFTSGLNLCSHPRCPAKSFAFVPLFISHPYRSSLHQLAVFRYRLSALAPSRAAALFFAHSIARTIDCMASFAPFRAR